jgi:hypothetical protein
MPVEIMPVEIMPVKIMPVEIVKKCSCPNQIQKR